MTKVSYNVCYKNRVVTNMVGYQDAVRTCQELGSGWNVKPVYTDFDPHNTPEYREVCKAHAKKVINAMMRKVYERELAHAPSYINNSGVGAT